MGGRTITIVAVALLVLIFGGSWVVDDTRAATGRVAASTSPRVLPADGQSTGTLIVRVTDADGAPRVGDTIEILNLTSQGTFDRTRALTDHRGQASFLYTTSLSNVYQPAGPVPVLITDTSLGHLIELDKMANARIDTVDPSKYKKGS